MWLTNGIDSKVSPFRKLIKKSELATLLVGLFRTYLARNVAHKKINFIDYPHTKINEEEIKLAINKHLPLLANFEKRVQKLVKTCRTNGIEPILITQPTLVGNGIDPITKINFSTISNGNEITGKTYWAILEKYNEITKEVGSELNIKTIDLAHQLPKSSLYFYDFIHFTNAGSEKVSEILATELIPFLQQQGH